MTDSYIPKTHHLDRRAAALIAAAPGDADALLTTSDVAEWIGLSTVWLEIGRTRGYGPSFVRLSTRRVRYRRSDVVAWLEQRTYASTAAYSRPRMRRRSPVPVE